MLLSEAQRSLPTPNLEGAFMGQRFTQWKARSQFRPRTYEALSKLLGLNRDYTYIEKLAYGDYGLEAAYDSILKAMQAEKKIALYADYDVDGTMSCVSWIWFFESLGYKNYLYYIPDRFREGYGVNLAAIQQLVLERGAELIITMDTGITANIEAAWCKSQGIPFICTDHHKIQADKMPDCIILNPKMHPDPLYQELCGCGITFVLLRKLAEKLQPPASVWPDILALTGMATICDVVPLNGVNHRLAQLGIQALMRSQRPIFQKLLKAAALLGSSMDERDVGFRLGPRINAVGRLEHAETVVKAFIHGDPEALIQHMGLCNEKRKVIQHSIVEEARAMAKDFADEPILFMGGDWHQGVVGIAASKLAEEFWKPVWLYHKSDTLCKGSARSIAGFDVTAAMATAAEYFSKFGGHSAAGGFSFAPENTELIRAALTQHAQALKTANPKLWQSSVTYDCVLGVDLLELPLTDCLDKLRPFGHGFAEPLFMLEAEIKETTFYKDKKTGLPRHTAVAIKTLGAQSQKIMFFNEVHSPLAQAKKAKFLVSAGRNSWMGQTSLSLMGSDFEVL